jgi:hypothetical protein
MLKKIFFEKDFSLAEFLVISTIADIIVYVLKKLII